MEYLKELTQLINSGKCWAVIGAGASCDMGLPSWEKLAKTVYAHIVNLGVEHDTDTYTKYLNSRKFPEVFSLAERDLGGLEQLLEVVKKELVPTKEWGGIYGFVSRWPFKSYLTTNFDNYLKDHLDKTGVAFTVLENSPDDFCKIRAETQGVIAKLHGSLDDPANVVLTSEQYANFRSSPAREYFGRKLGSIFEMVNVVIIGYSISDPDIDLILEQARHFASPQHPIYMIAADITKGEAQDFYRTKNIRAISYPNPDGTHQTLVRRVLPLMDRFIAPRVTGDAPKEIREPEGDDTAVSLYIYSRARLQVPDGDFIDSALEGLILRQLAKDSDNNVQSIDEAVAALPIPSMSEDLRARGHEIARRLGKRGVIHSDTRGVRLTAAGRNIVDENEGKAELLREQVAAQIRLDFSNEFPENIEHEASSFVEAAIRGLSIAMKRRGLSIAACVFAEASANMHEGLDIFSFLREASNQLQKFEYRAFYIQYLAGVIAEPSPLFRHYLAGLSQGHFAFHALGLHHGASRLRHEWLRSTVWILDSSMILPLLAKNCYSHQYALDLFKRIRDLRMQVFTTQNLFEEVVDHLRWAKMHMSRYDADSTEFMMIALLRADYKQNLFIDGFIRTAASNPALTFDNYIESIFGDGARDNIELAIERILFQFNVQTKRFSEWEGFRAIDWGDRPYWSRIVHEDRTKHGTYRSDRQCDAEAEVLVLLLGERAGAFQALDEGPSRAYFVTQSGVLRRVFPNPPSPVWSPEALYRYLLLFPTNVVWDDDAVYEAIRSDLFLSGISVIDKQSYTRFFNPQINEANLRMDEARTFIQEGEAKYLELFTNFYESVPDLEKPFYMLQVAWEIAKRERERANRAKIAAPLADKERKELAHLRAEKKLREQSAKHKRRSIEQRKARKKAKKKRH